MMVGVANERLATKSGEGNFWWGNFQALTGRVSRAAPLLLLLGSVSNIEVLAYYVHGLLTWVGDESRAHPRMSWPVGQRLPRLIG
jgi:hypothetical protein